MKEKVLKYIIELVFIFIIPLVLLATCFKQEKVYDENNNEVGKYLTFDNIFILSNETKTYYSNSGTYLFVEGEYNLYNLDYIYIDNYAPYSTANGISDDSGEYLFHLGYKEDDSIVYDYSFYPYGSEVYDSNDESGFFIPIEITNSYVRIKASDIIHQIEDLFDYQDLVNNCYIYSDYCYINPSNYTISDNVVSRLLNSLYDTLGITSNWILQFIVVYTLLWLIMWFIWHILYLPLDFICSKLLFDRVDK